MLSPSPSPMPVLTVRLPAIQDVKGGEGLSSLWHVFSKCRDSIEDGGRLENISWRLWYRHLHPPHSSSRRSSFASDDESDSSRNGLAIPSSPVGTASSYSHSDVSSLHSGLSERSYSPPASPPTESVLPAAASSSRPFLNRSSSSIRQLGLRADFAMSSTAIATESNEPPSTSGNATPRPPLGLRSNSTPRTSASIAQSHPHDTHSTQSSPRGGTYSRHNPHHSRRSRNAISAHPSAHDLSSNNMMSFGRVLGEVFREGMTTTGGREMLIQRERERSQLSLKDRSFSRKSVERYRPSSAASSNTSFASAIEAYAEAEEEEDQVRDRTVAARGRDGLKKSMGGPEGKDELVIQFIGPTPANTEPNTPAGSGKQTPVGTLSPLHYNRPTFYPPRRSEPAESLVENSASPFEEAHSFSDTSDHSLGITTSSSSHPIVSGPSNLPSTKARFTSDSVLYSSPSSNDPPSSDSASTAREIKDPASDTAAAPGRPKMFFIQSPNDNSESGSFGGSEASSMGIDDRGIGFGRDDGTIARALERPEAGTTDLVEGEREDDPRRVSRGRRSSSSSTGAASSTSAGYAPTSSSPLKLMTLPPASPLPAAPSQSVEPSHLSEPSRPSSPTTARQSPIATIIHSPAEAVPLSSQPTLPNKKAVTVNANSTAPKKRRKSSSAVPAVKPFALTSVVPKRSQPPAAPSTTKAKRRASAGNLTRPGFGKGLSQIRKPEETEEDDSDDQYEEVGSAEDEDAWSEEASVGAKVASMLKPEVEGSKAVEEVVVLQDENESGGEWASDDNSSPITATSTQQIAQPAPRPKPKPKKSFTTGNASANTQAHPSAHGNTTTQVLAPPKLASKRQVSAQSQKRLLSAQVQLAREQEAERQRTMFQKISPSKSAADLYGLGKEISSAPVTGQGSADDAKIGASGLAGGRVGSGLLSNMFRGEREKRELAMMPPPSPAVVSAQPETVQRTLAKQKSHSSSQDLWQHHRNVVAMTSTTKSPSTTSGTSAAAALLPITKSSAALPLESGLVAGRGGIEGRERAGSTYEPSDQAVSPVKSIFSGNGHGPAGEASEAQKRLSTLSKKASFTNIRHGFSALLPLSTTTVSPSASSVSSSGTHARANLDASPEPFVQADPMPPAAPPSPPLPPPPSASSVSVSATPPPDQDNAPSPPSFAAPQSPRTTRRAMLAAELPEELRKQLLWERMSRQKILGPGATRAPTAAVNGNGIGGVAGKLARSTSTPKLDGESEGRGEATRPNIGTRSSTSSGETTPQPAQSSSTTPTGSTTTGTTVAPPLAPLAKRSTVLGGTLLRPLTTVSPCPSPPLVGPTVATPSGNNSPLQRSKSSSSRLPPRRNKRSSTTAGTAENVQPSVRRFNPRTGEDMDSSDEEQEIEKAREKREGVEAGEEGKLKRRNTHHGNISSMYYADEGWDADYHSRGF